MLTLIGAPSAAIRVPSTSPLTQPAPKGPGNKAILIDFRPRCCASRITQRVASRPMPRSDVVTLMVKSSLAVVGQLKHRYPGCACLGDGGIVKRHVDGRDNNRVIVSRDRLVHPAQLACQVVVAIGRQDIDCHAQSAGFANHSVTAADPVRVFYMWEQESDTPRLGRPRRHTIGTSDHPASRQGIVSGAVGW